MALIKQEEKKKEYRPTTKKIENLENRASDKRLNKLELLSLKRRRKTD